MEVETKLVCSLELLRSGTKVVVVAVAKKSLQRHPLLHEIEGQIQKLSNSGRTSSSRRMIGNVRRIDCTEAIEEAVASPQ